MAAPTAEEIRQLSEQAQEFRPAERRPSTFLSLAPKTSDSYPRAQQAKTVAAAAPLTAEALAEVPDANSKRRASSLSSDASKFRFLKLGPVHWGEHRDEDKTDFHEVAVEE
ncbi:hypothetical protein QBC35DRAFT_104624 [Podospora australis]|uniref:Uncharacterized protein n=1 Tax=Podospora australis TaxID=1536484 RepID=A0AAN7ANM5_9PEZI|nr:hypothetical protein QBC35DRAFT_104624 [Podospora australis]